LTNASQFAGGSAVLATAMLEWLPANTQIAVEAYQNSGAALNGGGAWTRWTGALLFE
jgi:hypothetical protein